MNITAYTIEDCFYCEQLYELIKRTDMQSNTNFIKVGSDLSRNDFIQMCPEATGYPYVIIDGHPVGGLVETAKLFLEKGLITSKKNERS
jgi:glutaredoxin